MRKIGLVAGFAFALLLPLAKADQIQFTFNLSGCTGGCTLPAGTVTLTQDGSAVDVLVNLNNPLASGFIDTGNGNSHTSFVFDINGTPKIDITNLSAGFTFPADSTVDSPFGTFDYGIDCASSGSPKCGPGASNVVPPPLMFSIGRTDGSTLSLSDFGSNSYSSGGKTYQVFFAADIFDSSTGNTGAVGAAGPGVPIPEPGSLALCSFGFVGAAGLRRRHTK